MPRAWYLVIQCGTLHFLKPTCWWQWLRMYSVLLCVLYFSVYITKQICKTRNTTGRVRIWRLNCTTLSKSISHEIAVYMFPSNQTRFITQRAPLHNEVFFNKLIIINILNIRSGYILQWSFQISCLLAISTIFKHLFHLTCELFLKKCQIWDDFIIIMMPYIWSWLAARFLTIRYCIRKNIWGTLVKLTPCDGMELVLHWLRWDCNQTITWTNDIYVSYEQSSMKFQINLPVWFQANASEMQS